LSAEQIKSDYALGEGSHSVTVYVNDTAGNWNSSTVGFGIHTYIPPASSSIAGFVSYAYNETGSQEQQLTSHSRSREMGTGMKHH